METYKEFRFGKYWKVQETMTYLTLNSDNFCGCVRTLCVKGVGRQSREHAPVLAAALAEHVWTWRGWSGRPAVQSV